MRPDGATDGTQAGVVEGPELDYPSWVPQVT